MPGRRLDPPFKAYDLRGRIPAEINAPFAYRFAKATAKVLAPGPW